MTRRIIFVPGLRPKPPPQWHARQLRRCLLEGVRRADPAGARLMAAQSDLFELVDWTPLFYGERRPPEEDEQPVEVLLAKAGADVSDRREARSWRRRLRRGAHILGDRLPALIDWIASDDDALKLREAERYFADRDGVGRAIRQKLCEPLRGAWSEQREVLLIGHSLGSVIAYECLWGLSREQQHPGRVALFLTLGSPLATRFMRRRLAGTGESGPRRYPDNVRRWLNAAAVGDMTALNPHVARVYAAMVRLGLCQAVEDLPPIYTWYRDSQGLNVHMAYGYLVHPAVGAAIAGWWRSESRVSVQV